MIALMKPLPIGIQDFKKLREGGYLYIDKTEDILRLIQEGNYYFLSRPRRFGKSLLLSTLKEIFLGNQFLFEGLWIADKWSWERHPVIHISFNSIGYHDIGLERAIQVELLYIAEKHGIEITSEGVSRSFRELVEKLGAGQNKVVILIDEYDKPIIDYIDDIPTAERYRNTLKNFYSIVKSSDPFIRFFFITGVSKFSRVSLFSDLNNLRDLTLSPKFSCITGYTHDELLYSFSDRIARICQKKEISQKELFQKIIDWYDGYSWDGKNRLFNPFSILSYFSDEEFFNFWWQTGTPNFLIQLLRKGMHFNLENITGGQDLFESYTLDHLEYRALLFQTGYLTINSIDEYGLYLLTYPNKEVQDSMYRHLLGAFRHAPTADTQPLIVDIKKSLDQLEIGRFIELINSLFDSLPYQIFIRKQEAFFHAILHIALNATGMFIETEVSTSNGRVDAVIHTDNVIYILEIKLDSSAELAMKQIKNRSYGTKYLHTNKEVFALGINFSSKDKKVSDWKLIPYKKLLNM